jgi:hypothetical protein
LYRRATFRLTQHDDASSLTIQTTIFLAQSSDDTPGVSGSDDAIRDRPSDDTARTDDRFRTDVDARTDNCPATDPNIVTNGNRLSKFDGSTWNRLDGMRCRIEMNPGAKEDVSPITTLQTSRIMQLKLK